MALRQKQRIPQDDDFLVQGYFPDATSQENAPSYRPNQPEQAVYQAFDPYAGPPPGISGGQPPYPAQEFQPNGYLQGFQPQGYQPPPQQGYPPQGFQPQGYQPSPQQDYPPQNPLPQGFAPGGYAPQGASRPAAHPGGGLRGVNWKELITNPSKKTLIIAGSAVAAIILLIVILSPLFRFDAKKDMQEAIRYFRQITTADLISIADRKDANAMVQKLQEAIPRFEDYTGKYEGLMGNTSLTPQEKIAATHLKAAFYDVNANCLKPMLSAILGQGGQFPDYAVIVNNSLEAHIIPAEQALAQ